MSRVGRSADERLRVHSGGPGRRSERGRRSSARAGVGAAAPADHAALAAPAAHAAARARVRAVLRRPLRSNEDRAGERCALRHPRRLHPVTRAALLLVLLAAATSAHAGDRQATLDALVADQRPSGGWLFAAPPGERPQPYTQTLRVAERIARPLHLASWDLLAL